MAILEFCLGTVTNWSKLGVTPLSSAFSDRRNKSSYFFFNQMAWVKAIIFIDKNSI